MNIPELINDIVGWITKYCEENGIDSLIVGVSGGIDSSVVARLCEATGIRTICVSMPYEESNPVNMSIGNAPREGTSTHRAYKLCENRNVEYFFRTIHNIVDAYKLDDVFANPVCLGDTKLLGGNLRARIRANILHDFAGEYNGIVVGTGNKDEDEIGYFTKFGDGATDLNPLSNLHKSTVYKIAEELDDVPQDIIDTAPTAELWEGQTDEQELGMTYDEVEWALEILEGKIIPVNRFSFRQEEVFNKVRDMRKKNAHKLRYPPIFDPNNPERIE